MAKKTTLNLENLSALGVERLARLVLDASARDAGFMAAALASANGPEAIAALIDRRLDALERARSFVEWDRARTFASDLSMTVHAIVDELGPAEPDLAVERLLRFIATHSGVFERIDDSQGRVQDIYETAVDALGLLVTATSESERSRLPDVIMAKLGEEMHGYLPMVVSAVAQSLHQETLARWDSELGAKQAHRPTGKRENIDRTFDARSFAVIACRQAIAEARSDLDGFVALEQMKHPNLQNASDIAERMLASGRTRDALEWVRRPAPHRRGFVSNAELSDGRQMQDLTSIQRVSLEARILDTLGDRRAAQALRWASFEATLDVGILWEHVVRLEDFAEFEVLDRAFDHVSLAKASQKLQRMVEKLVSAYHTLDLANLAWAYWHARTAAVHIAPAHFGAAIEALQRGTATGSTSRPPRAEGRNKAPLAQGSSSTRPRAGGRGQQSVTRRRAAVSVPAHAD
jgi:hypothetical protein